MSLQILWKCIIGPRLFFLYKTHDNSINDYIPNNSEFLSDSFIKLCSLTWNITVYASSLILFYFYKRNGNDLSQIYFIETSKLVIKSVALLSFTVAGSFLIRGLSRYHNSVYKDFIEKLTFLSKLPRDKLKDYEDLLNSYDFDFTYWPVIFKWKESELSDIKKPPQILFKKIKSTLIEKIKGLPIKIISYLAIKLFGRRMIYPGSVGILQKLMEPLLEKGRIRLVKNFKGKRFKLETFDKNHIDTIFIDNRKNTSNGNNLVICCEGNAGFYEIGIITTPIACGYSALGWNHPGFGGSTGTPYPIQEVNAIDTVIKFAVDKLGFKIKDIIIFAWSIGGYTGSWAAMHYPDIKGLILDATFDEITKLAVAKMPKLWKPLIIDAVSFYFNLNVSEQLKYYNGPLLIIRRTKDEVINTCETEPLKTNLSNDIIIKLFKNRFPKLMENESVNKALLGYLICDRSYYPYLIDSNKALEQLKEYIKKNGKYYPILIGEDLNEEEKINIIIYLTKKILIDFDDSHCSPLELSYLQIPWNLMEIL